MHVSKVYEDNKHEVSGGGNTADNEPGRGARDGGEQNQGDAESTQSSKQ